MTSINPEVFDSALDQAPVLQPGAQQPYPLMSAMQLAELLGVAEPLVLDWFQQGLPCDQQQCVEPFVAVNWLQQRHLSAVPSLAWRWRRYRAWLRKSGPKRTVTWRRQHRLYLPAGVQEVFWRLADCIPARGQRPISRDVLRLLEKQDAADGQSSPALPSDQKTHQVYDIKETPETKGPADKAPRAMWHYAHIDEGEQWCRWNNLVQDRPTTVTWQGEFRCQLEPWSIELSATERQALAAPIHQLAEQMSYAYRQHPPEQSLFRVPGSQLPFQSSVMAGSCLDVCLQYAVLIDRPCRLMSGLIADTSIANPHYWLEVETQHQQWCPVDPTIPLLMRNYSASPSSIGVPRLAISMLVASSCLVISRPVHSGAPTRPITSCARPSCCDDHAESPKRHFSLSQLEHSAISQCLAMSGLGIR